MSSDKRLTAQGLGREMALGGIFQLEFQERDKEDLCSLDWVARPPTGISREWALEIIRGYFKYEKIVRKTLETSKTKWPNDQLLPVVRAILKIAIVEFKLGTEKAVIINEAIRITKKFTGDNAYKFVNAVLDEIQISK